MHRGKKLVALANQACDLQNRSENVVLKKDTSNDPNKLLQVLGDFRLQCTEYRQLRPDTICSNITFPSNTFNDMLLDNTTVFSAYNVHNTNIANENFIIIPTEIEIESQATNILTSISKNNFDKQTFDITSCDHSINLIEDTCNTLDLDLMPSINILTSPTKTKSSVETTHQVLPNPPISDDSDIDKKLVPYSATDSDSSFEMKRKQKRKKRFEVNKKEWDSEKNKQRREEGKTYFGREKYQDYWNYNIPREARSIKPRCCCKIGKYSTLKCETLEETARKDIFNRFWSLTWGEKKILVNEWVTIIPTVRPRNRNSEENTKRDKTYVYYLKVNDESIKVCRKMFLNTLDIGRWTVQNWKQEFSTRRPCTLRRSTSTLGTISEQQQLLNQFLESLPVMESHYCRATSQKLYLLPEWKSKQSLYQFYVDNWCKERNVKALSVCVFSNTFESKNLALFKPKKDQCEKCACYKVGTVTEEEYKHHKEKSKEAREEKDADKTKEDYVFTVDLQAVLLAPKSNVSTLYYKTKLQVHNLCFFNIKNKDGFCFIWNEVEGGLNAEEFASIWVDFLEHKIIPEINTDDKNKTIIIYSDGCTYQNRNCILSNALLNIVMRYKNITIEQKFLEVGHTQMEADSVHSTIERHLKDKIINVPAEYISIAKHARKCPAPYIVQYLNHNYFKKFDKVQFYKSIRPGRSKGDLKVTDIRALRYENNGSILYKSCFKDEWQSLPQRRSLQYSPCEITELTQLHLNRRKISARKFEDLQQIKKTLPSDYHKYYDDLPHE